jgi:TonB family protein
MRLSIRHFVVVSGLAHAAILAMWVSIQSHTIQLPSAPSNAPVINIALQTETISSVPSHTSAKQHKVHKQKRKASRPQQPSKADSISSAQENAAPTPTPSASAYQAQLHRDQVRDRVLSKIRDNLQQYFVYPLLAQRQGWQGRVLLRFSVEANGSIQNIHVATGSGYTILDASAVNALTQVHHLYEASNWLQGKRLDLQMPVIFRLQGG